MGVSPCGLLARILLFLLGGGLLLTPLCLASLRADRSALASQAFRMGRDARTVIVGDSHTETSIDPARLPGGVNISRSAENYCYSYLKLRYFLDCNPQVRDVVLGFSPHNVMDQDRQFSEDRANHWKDYFILMDGHTRTDLASFRLPYLIAYLKAEYGVPFRLLQNPIAIKYLLGRSNYSRADFPFNGGYQALRGSFLDAGKIAKRAQDHFRKGEGYCGTSPVMVGYLRKIADLCDQRGVSLLLLDTPVTDAYRRLIPRQAMADFRRIQADLVYRHPRVAYLDLSATSLPPADFFDGNHLNREGAAVVTQLLRGRFSQLIPNPKE